MKPYIAPKHVTVIDADRSLHPTGGGFPIVLDDRGQRIESVRNISYHRESGEPPYLHIEKNEEVIYSSDAADRTDGRFVLHVNASAYIERIRWDWAEVEQNGLQIIEPVTEEAITDAYAAYDGDPRVSGPDDFDAFLAAITALLDRYGVLRYRNGSDEERD